MQSKAVYLIDKGKINMRALKDNRITINELLSEIRIQGYATINDIDYAVLEQSGKIALISKSSGMLEHPIIIDGVLDEELLGTIRISKKVITKRIKEEGLEMSDIVVMTINDNGNINIIKRMEK